MTWIIFNFVQQILVIFFPCVGIYLTLIACPRESYGILTTSTKRLIPLLCYIAAAEHPADREASPRQHQAV